jgi:polysaccharide pyruvyl transferase WcaK-like protein
LRRSGWRFRFFVFSKWDRDRTATVRARLGDRAEVFAGMGHRLLLRALGECHVVLGERLHSVVMACAAATPSVAIEYRPKIRDFMRSVDRGHLALRADALPARDIQEVVVALADERDAEAAHLRAEVAALTARLRESAAVVAHLAGRRR